MQLPRGQRQIAITPTGIRGQGRNYRQQLLELVLRGQVSEVIERAMRIGGRAHELGLGMGTDRKELGSCHPKPARELGSDQVRTGGGCHELSGQGDAGQRDPIDG